MATKNDITGDTIQTKPDGGTEYGDGWDRIFGNKNQKHKQQDLTELMVTVIVTVDVMVRTWKRKIPIRFGNTTAPLKVL